MTDAGADITGVAGVIVWTDRFDAMLRFYRDTLGLEPRGVKAAFANFAWGDFRLAVAAHDGVRGPARDPLRVMVNLAVADIHAAHERLAFLEGEVERLGREVERLDEAGRFTQKLLADRQGPDGLLPGSGAPRRRRPGNEPGA